VSQDSELKHSVKGNEMKLTNRSSLTSVLAGGFAAVLIAPNLSAAAEIDPEADRIFRAACKYLADAKAFCVKVEVWKARRSRW